MIFRINFSDNAWILLKALNYLKLNPICGVTSKDKTVLAISYGQVVVLYDLNDLKMMSALVSKHIQVINTDLKGDIMVVLFPVCFCLQQSAKAP